MSKNKNKTKELEEVEPLGDIKIAATKGNLLFSFISEYQVSRPKIISFAAAESNCPLLLIFNQSLIWLRLWNVSFLTDILKIGLLEQMVRANYDIITQIRTHTNVSENVRRIGEEKDKKDRNNKIHTEVITSHKKNVEIDWTW